MVPKFAPTHWVIVSVLVIGAAALFFRWSSQPAAAIPPVTALSLPLAAKPTPVEPPSSVAPDMPAPPEPYETKLDRVIEETPQMAAAIAAVEQEPDEAVRQQSAQFLLEVLSAMPDSPQADELR